MNARALVALVLVLLPAASSAQRLPTPRSRGPARPAPVPNLPPTVVRELSYVRLPYSVESYPLLSYHSVSRMPVDAGVSSWMSGGVGTRLDYRAAPMLSATVDLTSSFVGSPVRTETAELGIRLRPDRREQRLFPFADARLGFMQAYESFFQPYDVTDPYGAGAPVGPAARWSRGAGAVGGAGVEYALTRRLSLTTGATVMRSRMSTYALRGAGQERTTYWMTSYRLTLGLRFNPVRAIQPPGIPGEILGHIAR